MSDLWMGYLLGIATLPAIFLVFVLVTMWITKMTKPEPRVSYDAANKCTAIFGGRLKKS